MGKWRGKNIGQTRKRCTRLLMLAKDRIFLNNSYLWTCVVETKSEVSYYISWLATLFSKHPLILFAVLACFFLPFFHSIVYTFFCRTCKEPGPACKYRTKYVCYWFCICVTLPSASKLTFKISLFLQKERRMGGDLKWKVDSMNVGRACMRVCMCVHDGTKYTNCIALLLIHVYLKTHLQIFL